MAGPLQDLKAVISTFSTEYGKTPLRLKVSGACSFLVPLLDDQFEASVGLTIRSFLVSGKAALKARSRTF